MERARRFRSGPFTKLWHPGERIDQALAQEEREKSSRRSKGLMCISEKIGRLAVHRSSLSGFLEIAYVGRALDPYIEGSPGKGGDKLDTREGPELPPSSANFQLALATRS